MSFAGYGDLRHTDRAREWHDLTDAYIGNRRQTLEAFCKLAVRFGKRGGADLVVTRIDGEMNEARGIKAQGELMELEKAVAEQASPSYEDQRGGDFQGEQRAWPKAAAFYGAESGTAFAQAGLQAAVRRAERWRNTRYQDGKDGNSGSKSEHQRVGCGVDLRTADAMLWSD
jgi:hypothetical protein